MDPCLRRFQLARKFPDIGQVRVDRMGNIIGGVNPFEGTNVKLEDQPDPEDQEVSVKSANRALNLNYCSCTFTRSSTQDRALEAQTCNFGRWACAAACTSTAPMFRGNNINVVPV